MYRRESGSCEFSYLLFRPFAPALLKQLVASGRVLPRCVARRRQNIIIVQTDLIFGHLHIVWYHVIHAVNI